VTAQGLSTTAAVCLVLLAGAVTAMVLILTRRRRLAGRYALLWVGACAALIVLAAVPDLLEGLAGLVGVEHAPDLLLVLAVALLLLVAVRFSYELSRLGERTRLLAEEVALLRAEEPPAEEHGAGDAGARHPVGAPAPREPL
jgi:hypothetical protein